MQKKKRAQRGDAAKKDDNWKDSKLFESFLQQELVTAYDSIIDKDKIAKQ